MNGVINFLKPPGMSSSGAVIYLRGILGGVKTGHAGTLDPGACGVLPICVGRATKVSSYLMGGAKEYIAEITFGKSTDTGDSYGRVTGVSNSAAPSPEQVKEALKRFIGDLVQQTPAYSAVKLGGQKSYELARRGVVVPAKQRDIVIHDMEYLCCTRPDAHLIRVACGKGTYIRALCEDIGKSLGTLGYMSFLIRTKCAGLDIASSVTADELKNPGKAEEALIPVESFFESIPAVTAGGRLAKLLLNGASVDFAESDNETVRVYIEKEFAGLGRLENHKLKITTFLSDR
jgi:tRNA pseudouridine55 synthase